MSSIVSGGDWMCGACQHVNFKRRDTCQSCGYPKIGGSDIPTTYVCPKPGDWYCTSMNCGGHNYASRSTCYRCGAFKNNYSGAFVSDGSTGNNPPGWKAGDWICTRMGCGVHNYASRMECYKCKTPKDYGN